MTVTVEEFLSQALMILEKAEASGIHLRLLGSIAFRVHCPKNVQILDQMQRELTDIDFVGLSQERKKYQSFMLASGYEVDKGLLVATEGSRFFFKNPQTGLGVDIFVDKLEFCHTVWLKDRLELDKPTITLVDLLMEKMQIVEINPKDLKDTAVLLLEHELGEGDRDKIDVKYLTKIMSDDWGFYYTLSTNLGKCRQFLNESNILSDNQKVIVEHRIEGIIKALEESPKSMRWKMRAKIGTRMPWYQKVAEKEEFF